MAVARWFLSTLYGSFRSRCENQMEKKPFNPILGETFHCTWRDTNKIGWDESHIDVEQGTNVLIKFPIILRMQHFQYKFHQKETRKSHLFPCKVIVVKKQSLLLLQSPLPK